MISDKWNIEYTDEFGEWWQTLEDAVQERCAMVVGLLEKEGPNLRCPYSSEIKGSSIALRELRVQCAGQPYRILYAFDPARSALLILGGNKAANTRWYEEYVPKAEAIFIQYLQEIKEENK